MILEATSFHSQINKLHLTQRNNHNSYGPIQLKVWEAQKQSYCMLGKQVIYSQPSVLSGNKSKVISEVIKNKLFNQVECTVHKPCIQ